MKNFKVGVFLITLFFASFVVPQNVGQNSDVTNKAQVEAASTEIITPIPIAGVTVLLNDYTEEQVSMEMYENYCVTAALEPTYKTYDVPKYSGFKSWMPHDLFGKSTNQYKLQQMAYTGEYGIRYVDGYACIAIGTFANTKIGQRIDLVLENGTIIKCIMADEKSDKHTEANRMITSHSNCCSEFVIDRNALDKNVRRDGDMSSACKEWDSPVVQFYIYEENLLSLE